MMSETPLKQCLKCRSPIRRLIGTGGGIIFKGPGFYATDYRKADTKQDGKKKEADSTLKKEAESTGKKENNERNQSVPGRNI